LRPANTFANFKVDLLMKASLFSSAQRSYLLVVSISAALIRKELARRTMVTACGAESNILSKGVHGLKEDIVEQRKYQHVLGAFVSRMKSCVSRLLSRQRRTAESLLCLIFILDDNLEWISCHWPTFARIGETDTSVIGRYHVSDYLDCRGPRRPLRACQTVQYVK